MRHLSFVTASIVTAILAIASAVPAQSPGAYLLPPQNIVDILDAAPESSFDDVQRGLNILHQQEQLRQK